MNTDLVVTSWLVIPASELSWRFSRAGGPGGQGVNTTDSRVELSWDPAASAALTGERRERVLRRLTPRLRGGVLTLVSAAERSQLRNREDALERLAAIVRAAAAPEPPARRPTAPSRSARRRRTDDKKRRGEIKRLRRNPD